MAFRFLVAFKTVQSSIFMWFQPEKLRKLAQKFKVSKHPEGKFEKKKKMYICVM